MKGIKDILVHTGQHYDYNMSKVFFDELKIREPEYHLDAGSGSHGAQTGMILERLEKVLLKEKPDVVCVYGDTNTTLAGGLAAAKLHIPLVHIEAGLRSFNKRMPEEINRVVADHISTLLMCPSKTAINNLLNEGFKNVLHGGEFPSPEEISFVKQPDPDHPVAINTGDLMYDVLSLSLKNPRVANSGILKNHGLHAGSYGLMTLHRAENTDNILRFEYLLEFANGLAKELPILFPIHPRTNNRYPDLRKRLHKNIIPLEPLGYFDLLHILSHATIALTDSGGMQKEAFWLKVPCITLRNETEWVETLESGWNILQKDYKGTHATNDRFDKIYGDARASERIVSAVTYALS